MGIIDSRTFSTADGVALRLPDEIAFAPGTRVTIERSGDTLTVRPVTERGSEKDRLLALVDTLRMLPVPEHSTDRDRIEFPERPGLY